jgi:hypothetical protein
MAVRLETGAPSPAPPAVEKRAEPREGGSGPVQLQPETSHAPALVEGRLVDWSRGGFRAAHGCRSLQTGDVVHFQHDHGAGTARVVWLRIAQEGVEAGFLVVSHA